MDVRRRSVRGVRYYSRAYELLFQREEVLLAQCNEAEAAGSTAEQVVYEAMEVKCSYIVSDHG